MPPYLTLSFWLNMVSASMANTYFTGTWIWIAIFSSIAVAALQAALLMTICIYLVDRVTRVRSGRKVYVKAIIACIVLSLVAGVLISSLNSLRLTTSSQLPSERPWRQSSQ